MVNSLKDYRKDTSVKMLNLLVALTLVSTPTPTDFITDITRPPAVDISAIRQIRCDHWTGSGFLIGDKIMATANHVMDGGTGCRDVESGSPLKVYKRDKPHDLVLVTGPTLPIDIPYINISCERFKTGEQYLAYGISGFEQNHEIIRNNVLTATKKYTGKDFKFDDGMVVAHAREFLGYQAPGISGGPVMDIWGYAHGLVTGGSVEVSYHFEFADGILCDK
jgi:hypothetical protein